MSCHDGFFRTGHPISSPESVSSHNMILSEAALAVSKEHAANTVNASQ